MVTKEKDEELALFLEMRRREKERNNELVGAPLVGSNTGGGGGGGGGGCSPISKIVSSVPPPRKTAADNFLNSETDKSDYDWLLTPPGTPLFPSLEKESRRTVMSQIGMSNARPTALKPRLANVQEEPASRSNVASKNLALSSGVNSSSISNRRPSSSGGPKSASRSATPTGRSTIPTTSKPSRPSTPTSRATLPSTKPAAPPVRSSTPTRSTARSSTPTTRPSMPSSKPTSRAATPTRRPSTTSSAPIVNAPPSRSSSVTKSRPTTSKNPVPSRGTSPTVKSRPWKPSEMPGFSLDAPPNLRTSLAERPASASRGRPVAPGARTSSVEGGNGRPTRKSCSPSRGRTSNGSANGNGSSIPFVRRAHSNSSDNVSPLVIGTQMVERLVNMRKLAPPKQDNHLSTRSISGGQPSSLDSSGFGRTLSKKSLDMALRHMDIRRSTSGNLRPIMTNIPASSMYSVRSGSTKSRTVSVSDSPLATSSNASSEPSVNNFIYLDRGEMEDNDLLSERGNTSPSSQRGR